MDWANFVVKFPTMLRLTLTHMGLMTNMAIPNAVSTIQCCGRRGLKISDSATTAMTSGSRNPAKKPLTPSMTSKVTNPAIHGQRNTGWLSRRRMMNRIARCTNLNARIA